MARCLIIGCGCRGRALAGQLQDAGHAVRGTSRRASGVAGMEAAGIEPHLGDPDRVLTLVSAFDHVSVACLLLGTAVGNREQIRELHFGRLEMLLTRMLDTTIRGVVYEAAGSVDPELLAHGAEIVRRSCEDTLTGYAVLRADPAEPELWLEESFSAVQRLLEPAA